MTIIVFLIDTSASMNQRGYLGGRPTLLDVAKGAVETFVKVSKVKYIWWTFNFAFMFGLGVFLSGPPRSLLIKLLFFTNMPLY